ncbi:hypothetical protein ACFFYR_14325, partial [Paraburkholderia dipogonis]|uniref:hypothetical protein n=1 Tax=Paraburkholderia dipogonis TaxID=1211383 RepID=UPI0035EC33C2
MVRRAYRGFKQQAAVTRLYPIVFICQRAADKISGGRSPNDQAFESLCRVIGEPRARGVSGAWTNGIQTARLARSERSARIERLIRRERHSARTALGR